MTHINEDAARVLRPARGCDETQLEYRERQRIAKEVLKMKQRGTLVYDSSQRVPYVKDK